ncbi:MAG TPA: GIY-YIG nuclease family protein [bacterium]
MARQYFVYIMTNHSRTLYTGVTNNLERRVIEHKEGRGSKFTGKYRLTKLVWFEECPDIREAIAGEKRIKGWLKTRKVALIEGTNPNWNDLSADWNHTTDSSLRSE